jgi:hypothetical protein
MKLSLGISKIVNPLMIVIGALASSPMAWAQDSTEGPCSNRTLRGDYGFTVQGQILTGPTAVLNNRH